VGPAGTLEGHRSRAACAHPSQCQADEGIDALVNFMKDFRAVTLKTVGPGTTGRRPDPPDNLAGHVGPPSFQVYQVVSNAIQDPDSQQHQH
jgi:hypothetical protein